MFQKVKTGEVIDLTPIFVETKTGTESYQLPDKSTIRERYVVGLFVAEPQTDDDFFDRTKKLLTQKDFRNAYLTLRTDSQRDALTKIKLSTIADYNRQGKAYPITQGALNAQDCEIHIYDESNITPARLAVVYFQTKIPTTR